MERKELIWQLGKHGHSKDSLEVMPLNDLIKLFKKESKQTILDYMQLMKEDKQTENVIEDNEALIEEQLAEIRLAINGEMIDFKTLYESIEKIFAQYGLHETIELVLTQIRDGRYKQVTRIVELAYRAYQEKLLDKLEKLFEDYPRQERMEQMKFYGSKREDIQFLQETIQILENKKEKENLSRIAQLKYGIIRDYFPDSLYENYEEYYEDEEEKNKIIERIMKLTNAYKRPVLKKKRRQILQHIERVLLEDKEREKEEKNLIKKFTKQIGEAVSSEDEYEFSSVVKEALDKLDERDVRRIVFSFDISSNPILVQQFNILTREFRHS
ncbi:hypothetical protein [Helicobacter canadensis]|uniref:Uncharacterized protein n=1 Tax=Helicobacter canadensis MIT 98-5491 TaxID=537970 RepID=C5ZWP1_9HELI|nr:hypothetical protein [Helicobacter canadensis]EES89559.1 conserved hypothetical protein [Helicobacter canadensis MIT 98-5491]EFR48350.1 hypothetical protein HCMG_00523 [Helicobacter canadensis MIT 98-5491]STO99596.1 Uncharacterised protein [Helicobacter canadensis]